MFYKLGLCMEQVSGEWLIRIMFLELDYVAKWSCVYIYVYVCVKMGMLWNEVMFVN